MRYISTRGKAPALNFEEVLLTGLASDGGLYVPESLPKFSKEQINSWKNLPYHALAFHIIQPFVEGSVADADLKRMLKETYGEAFHHKDVAPLKKLGENEYLLELFHGPTLAFKDFALQLFGRLLDYVLQRHEQKVVIVGATSGDTGSAAIHGCKHCKNVDIFILHPKGRVSDVQRKQMTTVLESNVHNLAVEGHFDDCQDIVKQLFGERDFLGSGRSLVAVNSINWARIMAQIVYYFSAALALGGPEKSMAFSVPTGNFGDIYAGYLAKKMGLPIHQLVVATNKNDILHRFMAGNRYERGSLEPSLSPSMDIQVSSNFERLLFDVYGHDGAAIAALMDDFKHGAISVDDAKFKAVRELFDSARVDDDQTLHTITEVYQQTHETLDPHTAIGVRAARQCRKERDLPMITLATAHPAKFPAAIEKAGLPPPVLPEHLKDLLVGQERMETLAASKDVVKAHMLSSL